MIEHSLSGDVGQGGHSACPHCGGANLVTIACTSGPHHAQIECADCGRHIRFIPKPWTRERAESFRLGFGRYAGQTIGEVATENPGYLHWAAANLAGNPGIAARVVLGLEPGEATR